MRTTIGSRPAGRSGGAARLARWAAARVLPLVLSIAASGVSPSAAAHAPDDAPPGVAAALLAAGPPALPSHFGARGANDSPAARPAMSGGQLLAGVPASASAKSFTPPRAVSAPLLRWTLSHGTTTSLP